VTYVTPIGMGACRAGPATIVLGSTAAAGGGCCLFSNAYPAHRTYGEWRSWAEGLATIRRDAPPVPAVAPGSHLVPCAGRRNSPGAWLIAVALARERVRGALLRERRTAGFGDGKARRMDLLQGEPRDRLN
jgi:hypothetical protein